MDLELTDEQTWLAEALDTLLEREWTSARGATPEQRAHLWQALEAFGLLDELGAVELCLAARAFGAHLASTPFVPTAALRYATGVDARSAIALLEPGGTWATEHAHTSARPVDGVKLAVEHATEVERFAVVATADGAPVLALVAAGEAAAIEPQPSLDPGVPLFTVSFEGARADDVIEIGRLGSIGALLSAAEAVGAAGRLLEDARAYAAERRQFGRTIGANQALRHILADMYVRHVSAWSTVLYAAAALDDELPDARRTAAIAKAYVGRGAREVAHGALQVFGGIAFTEEHQAHRFLRRIIARDEQFGNAAHHERELGRALAAGLLERQAA